MSAALSDRLRLRRGVPHNVSVLEAVEILLLLRLERPGSHCAATVCKWHRVKVRILRVCTAIAAYIALCFVAIEELPNIEIIHDARDTAARRHLKGYDGAKPVAQGD